MSEHEQVEFRIKTWRDEISERERNIRLAFKWLDENPPQTVSEATKNIREKTGKHGVGNDEQNKT